MSIYTRLFFACIYTFVYAFLSLDLVGAGHGTIFFLIPLLTWPLPIVAIFLITTTMKRHTNTVFWVLMTIHSVITFLMVAGYLFSGDNGRLALTFRVSPYYCLFTVLWYLVGQITIWKVFVIRNKKNGVRPATYAIF